MKNVLSFEEYIEINEAAPVAAAPTPPTQPNDSSSGSIIKQKGQVLINEFLSDLKSSLENNWFPESKNRFEKFQIEDIQKDYNNLIVFLNFENTILWKLTFEEDGLISQDELISSISMQIDAFDYKTEDFLVRKTPIVVKIEDLNKMYIIKLLKNITNKFNDNKNDLTDNIYKH